MNPQTEEFTFDVVSPARLRVKNVRGLVEFKPGIDNIIKVTAIKDLDSGDPDNTDIVVEQDENGVVIAKVVYQHPIFSFGLFAKPCKVHFLIEAPAECSVNSKCVSAQTTISALKGKFTLQTVSGSISMQQLTGDLRLKTVSGRVSGAGLAGTVDAESVSGILHLTDSNLHAVTAQSVSGKIEIETPISGEEYKLESVSGKLIMVVPVGTACVIHAHSISGDFKTSLSANFLNKSRHNVDANFNGDGPSIHFNTVSGNMYLVTPENRNATPPAVKIPTREERLDILQKLEEGEITIEDALGKLVV